MAEYASDVDSVCPVDNKSIILVGRKGNGKSATGNSIIEADVFDKMSSSAFVTSCCSLTTFSDNAQILTIIDTPGSFDIFIEPESIGIEKGIHAVVVVLSLKTRFSVEDYFVIENLFRYFGAKLSDYMIVVFTHGDALEDMSLDDYLGCNCPEQLAKTLKMCGNRFVIFDNVTEDIFTKFDQREELLRLVDEVVAHNGGIPYTDDLFVEPKEDQWERNDQHDEAESSKISENVWKAYYENQLLEMESKHQETTLRLEKQLEDEHVARIQAEAAQTKSNEEISKVRDDLKRVQNESRKLRKTHRETEKILKKKIHEMNQKKNIAILNQIEAKIGETTLRLENQLADKLARMQAEDDKAQEAEMKSNDEMRKLRQDMDRVQRYTGETFKKILLKMDDDHQIDSKQLRERITELERALADEQAGRIQAEVKTQEVEKKAKDAISKLSKDLEKAQRKREKQKIKLKISEITLLEIQNEVLNLWESARERLSRGV